METNSTIEAVLRVIGAAGIVEGADIVSALPYRSQSTVRGYLKQLIDGGYVARGYVLTDKSFNGTNTFRIVSYAPAPYAAYFASQGAGL